MGHIRNDIVSKDIQQAVEREHRRAWLETAVLQEYGWVQDIGDMNDEDLRRMIPEPRAPEWMRKLNRT